MPMSVAFPSIFALNGAENNFVAQVKWTCTSKTIVHECLERYSQVKFLFMFKIPGLFCNRHPTPKYLFSCIFCHDQLVISCTFKSRQSLPNYFSIFPQIWVSCIFIIVMVTLKIYQIFVNTKLVLSVKKGKSVPYSAHPISPKISYC